MIGRAILAIAVTAALTALGGPIGFGLGVGLALAILTAPDPTPRQQRDALRGLVAFAIVGRFMR